MLKIKINGIIADIQGTKFRMVLNNPAFSSGALVGDHSYSVSFPGTENNRTLFGFQHRPDIRYIPDLTFPIVINIHGNDVFSGSFALETASDNFSGNITAGASRLIEILENLTTDQIDYGDSTVYPDMNAWKDSLMKAREVPYPDSSFSWFPVLNRNLFEDAPQSMKTAWEQIQYINTDDLLYNHMDSYVLFPYLPFVLDKIFDSNGYKVLSNVFTSGELASLVLYSPFRQLNYTFYKHNHRDHVGKYKILELLNGIRNMFNVGFFTNHLGNHIHIVPLKDLLTTEIIDLTDKVVDISERDFTFEHPDGHDYGYDWDSGCKTVGEFLLDKFNPEDYTVFFPRSNRFVLPPADVSSLDQICFIRNESAYYICKYTVPETYPADPPYYSWERLTLGFMNSILEKKERSLQSTLSTIFPNVAEKEVYPGNPIPWNDQAIIDSKGFKDTYFNYELYWRNFNFSFLNDIQPKLLFYRGMIDNQAFASCDCYNPAGQESYDLTLNWNGEKGLFNVWHRDWVKFLDSATVHTFKVMLSTVDIMNIDLRKRVRIGANVYLIKKIELTLPMDAPASIELMRINC